MAEGVTAARVLTSLVPVGLVLVCGLLGCAGEVQFGEELQPLPLPEVIEAANYAYLDCISQTAERLDDGRLSPIGVALKVIPLCEMQFAAYEALAAQGNDRFGGRLVRNGLEREKEQFVTDVVLRMRLNRELAP